MAALRLGPKKAELVLGSVAMHFEQVSLCFVFAEHMS